MQEILCTKVMIVPGNQLKQVIFIAPPNNVGQEFAWPLGFLTFHPQIKQMIA